MCIEVVHEEFVKSKLWIGLIHKTERIETAILMFQKIHHSLLKSSTRGPESDFNTCAWKFDESLSKRRTSVFPILPVLLGDLADCSISGLVIHSTDSEISKESAVNLLKMSRTASPPRCSQLQARFEVSQLGCPELPKFLKSSPWLFHWTCNIFLDFVQLRVLKIWLLAFKNELSISRSQDDSNSDVQNFPIDPRNAAAISTSPRSSRQSERRISSSKSSQQLKLSTDFEALSDPSLSGQARLLDLVYSASSFSTTSTTFAFWIWHCLGISTLGVKSYHRQLSACNVSQSINSAGCLTQLSTLRSNKRSCCTFDASQTRSAQYRRVSPSGKKPKLSLKNASTACPGSIVLCHETSSERLGLFVGKYTINQDSKTAMYFDSGQCFWHTPKGVLNHAKYQVSSNVPEQYPRKSNPRQNLSQDTTSISQIIPTFATCRRILSKLFV